MAAPTPPEADPAADPTATPESDSVDLTLRHVTQQFPADLAHALLPQARSLTECVWRDTQVTARERRMDKTLFVIADGVARLEHVEWQLRWSRNLLLRMYEYHCLTTLGLHAVAKKGETVPCIRSTVVLLGGRRVRPWPDVLRFRVSPPGEPFSGLRVRVEAVYQRTVAELEARDAPLWMVFAPLAVDATPDAMTRVLDALRARTDPRQFEELAVAMTVLADADVRGRGLRAAITSHLPEEIVMQSWVYKQGVEKGIEEGIEKGIEEGIEKGIEKGRQEGRQETLRQSIALILTARGLRLTATRRAQLDAETRIEVLNAWLTRAATAARAADVFAAD